jgi:hypothetical protein
MKRVIALLLISSLLVLALAGCGGPWIAPVVPPQGIAFSSTKAPIDTDFNNTDLGTKMGQSSTVCVLALLSFGDASIYTAARNGNVEIIKHADYSYLNVLGLFQQFTLIAYGD